MAPTGPAVGVRLGARRVGMPRLWSQAAMSTLASRRDHHRSHLPYRDCRSGARNQRGWSAKSRCASSTRAGIPASSLMHEYYAGTTPPPDPDPTQSSTNDRYPQDHLGSTRPANSRFRRISPIAAHSGDRLLSEPTAGTQLCRREPLFMPHAVISEPAA